MIEITGGKVPKSDKFLYQIWADRGTKFWGMQALDYIGCIINGVIYFEAGHSPKEAEETEAQWEVLSITEKF